MNKLKIAALIAGVLVLIPVVSSLILLAMGVGIAWLVWNKDKVMKLMDDIKDIINGAEDEVSDILNDIGKGNKHDGIDR